MQMALFNGHIFCVKMGQNFELETLTAYALKM